MITRSMETRKAETNATKAAVLAAAKAAFPGVKFSCAVDVRGNAVKQITKGGAYMWYGDKVTITCFGHEDIYDALYSLTRQFVVENNINVQVNCFSAR